MNIDFLIDILLCDKPSEAIKNNEEKIFVIIPELKLCKNFDKISIGYDKDDIANPKDMEKYYSKEEQDKYGVIGIEVKVIEDRK